MQKDVEAKLKFLSAISQNSPITIKFSISFADVLGLLFIALKLVGSINWSWFFVLTPLYIPIIIKALVNWWHEHQQAKQNENDSKTVSN